jgi:hypothetical protein
MKAMIVVMLNLQGVIAVLVMNNINRSIIWGRMQKKIEKG